MPDRYTNCVNCGAPLHGNKCEYCGTQYGAKRGTEEMPLLLSRIESSLERNRELKTDLEMKTMLNYCKVMRTCELLRDGEPSGACIEQANVRWRNR